MILRSTFSADYLDRYTCLYFIINDRWHFKFWHDLSLVIVNIHVTKHNKEKFTNNAHKIHLLIIYFDNGATNDNNTDTSIIWQTSSKYNKHVNLIRKWVITRVVMFPLGLLAGASLLEREWYKSSLLPASKSLCDLSKTTTLRLLCLASGLYKCKDCEGNPCRSHTQCKLKNNISNGRTNSSRSIIFNYVQRDDFTFNMDLIMTKLTNTRRAQSHSEFNRIMKWNHRSTTMKP